MPTFQDFYYNSSTGENQLHARICLPNMEAKAIVQIAHGIADYIRRYDEFMEYLAHHGYIVVGNDHLGHGDNIKEPLDVGFFAAKNGWDYAVKDMDRLRDIMREEYPDLPYIFFGHSMGSFLTRTYIIKNPDKYDAVILSGTGHQSKALILSGYALASTMVKLHGPRADGAILNEIAFGAYNNRINDPLTPFDWVSRDKDMVAKYEADPLCGFVAKTSLYRDMMGGLLYITNQKNISTMNTEPPVYFMSGAADPVGDYGAGVEKAYKAFCKAGCKDVFMRLYPEGRHEMLNEINRQEVYADVLNWLEQKLPLI